MSHSAGWRSVAAELDRTLQSNPVKNRPRHKPRVACYEPSQVLRVAPDGTIARLIGDEEAHLFCHPTNLAFRGGTLFTANLGRWHITAVDTRAEGLPLHGGYSGGR